MYILKEYDNQLQQILYEGIQKSNRTCIDTLSLFGLQGRYQIDKFFPIPTKRKYFYKSIFAELLWMLSGSTNVNDLENMNSKIWTAWKNIDFEQANNYQAGELGPIYGFQMRHFGGDYQTKTGGIDQIQNAINELKNNKYSRRILINLWDANVMFSSKVRLPCCHYAFQLLVDNQDRLTGILSQRSGDFMPGVPANIIFYSALVHMFAQQANLKPYQLIHNVADAHIYLNQIDAVKEYLNRKEINSPKLELKKAKDIFSYNINNFEIKDYQCGEIIKVPVAI